MPTIKGDEGLLGQVLNVLLTNALNYTPAQGQVTVTTQTSQSDVQEWIGFSVSDTGPGIMPEEREQLFLRFTRGKAGLESGAAGTGLGLSIAKQIVDRHEGRIEVISEGVPGEGATFSVWLPIDE